MASPLQPENREKIVSHRRLFALASASLPVLAARLAGRGRESADDIAARLAASAGFRPPADCRVLCNDGELAVAGDELVAWLSSHCHQPITAL